MRHSRIPRSIDHLNLAVIYGGQPLSRRGRMERWLENHATDMLLVACAVVLAVTGWVLSLLWFQGVI